MSGEMQIKQQEESPPSRGAWIEIGKYTRVGDAKIASPPSRGAWIEICSCGRYISLPLVAPLAGGVD